MWISLSGSLSGEQINTEAVLAERLLIQGSHAGLWIPRSCECCARQYTRNLNDVQGDLELMSSEFVAKGGCVACLWQALCFWFGPCVFGLLVYFFWRGLASISFIGSTSATVEAAFGDTSQCLLGSSARSPVKVAWFQLPFAAQTHTNTYVVFYIFAYSQSF